MVSALVVKVKHGESVKRVNISVDETGFVDLNLDGLKSRILNLFNISPDADVTLTYLDEDGDLITLANEDDLSDAIDYQGLNPIRIVLKLNQNDAGKSERSSPGRAMVSSQSPQCYLSNVKSALSELLESISQPQETIFWEIDRELMFISASLFLELLKMVESGVRPLDIDSIPCWNSRSNSSMHNQLADCDVSRKLGASKDISIDDELNKLNVEKERGLSFLQNAASSDSTRSAGDSFPVTPTAHVSEWNKGREQTEAHIQNSIASGSVMDSYSSNSEIPRSSPSEIDSSSSYSSSSEIPRSSSSEIDSSSSYSSNSEIPRSSSSEIDSSSSYSSNSEIPKSSSSEIGYESTVSWDSSPSSNSGSSIHDQQADSKVFLELRASKDAFCPSCLSIGDELNKLISQSNREKVNVASFYNNMDSRAMRADSICSAGDSSPETPTAQGSDWGSILPSTIPGCSASETGYESPPTDDGAEPAPLFNYTLPGDRPSNLQLAQNSGMRPQATRLDSLILEEITILNGARMDPGTSFTKIWRMYNSGTICWPAETELVWLGGNKLVNKVSVKIDSSHGVCVCNEINIAINFKAPEHSGRYISDWVLSLPSGYKFGEVISVDIQVVNPYDD